MTTPPTRSAPLGASKEQLRRLLAYTTLHTTRAERVRFNQHVTWAAIPETTRAKKTIDAWWDEIETPITTRVTNALTKSANVRITNTTRAVRGYRSHENHTRQIMLYNTVRMAA